MLVTSRIVSDTCHRHLLNNPPVSYQLPSPMVFTALHGYQKRRVPLGINDQWCCIRAIEAKFLPKVLTFFVPDTLVRSTTWHSHE